MSRKDGVARQHDTEYTFTRAFTDMVDGMKLEFDCIVEVRMFATSQKGVLFIEMKALDVRAGLSAAGLAKVSSSYPDGRTLTLSAKLFQLSNSLFQMVEGIRGAQYQALFKRA